jgi:tripartite-type tricarboxylate transporter receptor subunit TctC
MERRQLLRGVAGMAAALAWPGAPLRAQAFPSRAIRIVVPYAPGGTSDILARTLAIKVGESIGQQVVVENKPGANGVLGSDLVAKAPADGHSLLLTDVSGLTSAPFVVANLPFDPVRDLAPVTMIAYSPHLVVVPSGSPPKSLAELVAYSKSRPAGLNAATVGSGSATHLAAAMFARRAGLDWTYVPYKGGAQALNDLAAGQADVMFNGMLATLPVVRGGKLRAIAVSSARRWPTLPELPTVGEQGYPGFLTGSWQGLLAPAGTPADVLARLSAEFGKALAQPDVRERLAAQGAEPMPMAPEAFAEFLRSDSAKWAQVVKDAGIRPE